MAAKFFEVKDEEGTIRKAVEQYWEQELDLLRKIMCRLGSVGSVASVLPHAIDRHYRDGWKVCDQLCAADVSFVFPDLVRTMIHSLSYVRHMRERALAVLRHQEIIAMSHMSYVRVQWLGAVARVALRCPIIPNGTNYYQLPVFSGSHDVMVSGLFSDKLKEYEGELRNYFDYVLHPAFSCAIGTRSADFLVHAIVRGDALIDYRDICDGNYDLASTCAFSKDFKELFRSALVAASRLQEVICEQWSRTGQTTYASGLCAGAGCSLS